MRRNACRRLVEVIFNTAKRIGALFNFGESVLSTARKFRKPALSTVKLVEVRRVRFHHRDACRRLVEVWRVRFEHLNAGIRLVEVRSQF